MVATHHLQLMAPSCHESLDHLCLGPVKHADGSLRQRAARRQAHDRWPTQLHGLKLQRVRHLQAAGGTPHSRQAAKCGFKVARKAGAAQLAAHPCQFAATCAKSGDTKSIPVVGSAADTCYNCWHGMQREGRVPSPCMGLTLLSSLLVCSASSACETLLSSRLSGQVCKLSAPRSSTGRAQTVTRPPL